MSHEDGAGPSATVERLADVVDWEAFRILGDDDVTVLCTIALRPEGPGRLAYAVWRATDDEPGATGVIAALDGAWSDATREDAIRQIAFRYEEDLRIGPDDLAFRIGEDEGAPAESDDSREDEDDEDDEDE